MGFISLIAALLLEQWQPLSPANRAYGWFGRYVHRVSAKYNRGRGRDGLKAWLLVVLPVTISAALITVLLHWAGPLFLLAWTIAALYFAFGFRHHSNLYMGVMAALKAGDLLRARELLSTWRGQPAQDFSADEVSRAAVELALLQSHRHVFGVIAWFIILGPAGALGYRITALLAERGPLSESVDKNAAKVTLEGYAAHIFHYIDYIPVRLTALMFAFVGDFMSAIRHWRQVAYRYQQGQDIVLASGAGALGSMPSAEGGPAPDKSKSAFEYMQAASELMWRALVLWLFLIMVGTMVSRI